MVALAQRELVSDRRFRRPPTRAYGSRIGCAEHESFSSPQLAPSDPGVTGNVMRSPGDRYLLHLRGTTHPRCRNEKDTPMAKDAGERRAQLMRPPPSVTADGRAPSTARNELRPVVNGEVAPRRDIQGIESGGTIANATDRRLCARPRTAQSRGRTPPTCHRERHSARRESPFSVIAKSRG